MTASTVFRQLGALLFGFFGWRYYFTMELFSGYPQWVGFIIIAFAITLVTVMISENILIGILLPTAVYLFYGPGIYGHMDEVLPLYGGVAAACAVWKII